jgi:hypothetical protein
MTTFNRVTGISMMTAMIAPTKRMASPIMPPMKLKTWAKSQPIAWKTEPIRYPIPLSSGTRIKMISRMLMATAKQTASIPNTGVILFSLLYSTSGLASGKRTFQGK